MRKKYPDLRILIVVPTITLKDQWYEKLNENNLYFNIEVQVINTVIKHDWSCDMLIIDEYHVAAADQLSKVFTCIKYKLILGLTATFERLDGRHTLLQKYCPIVDVVTTLEALANGWISQYKEYQVLIDVDDIDVYKEYNRQWTEHFEFFQFDFGLAMKMVGPEGWKAKLAYRDTIYKGNDEEKKKQILNAINYHAMGFVRIMTQRKAFINNHPKKIEIAKKIMDARPDSKIITFSNNVKMAEALENGNYVYTGKTSRKRASDMIEQYASNKIKHLHSCKRLIEGFDDPNTNVAIILGLDSSERRAVQTRGRVIRKTTHFKQAEIFNLVIRDTQELKWFKDSHKNSDYITINEEGLDKVLRGEPPTEDKTKQQEFVFRY